MSLEACCMFTSGYVQTLRQDSRPPVPPTYHEQTGYRDCDCLLRNRSSDIEYDGRVSYMSDEADRM